MLLAGTSLLPWHAAGYSQLQALHAQGRLGHAWLLSGLQGTGKLMLARHFARYLLCSNVEAGMPCGTCKDCKLFLAGTHPDFRLLQAEKKLITIEQIRDSIEFAQATSQQGGMKILVVDPADAMNANAANALLKILEEPPERTLLLLTSHQPGLLLATIRSRCQFLRCPLPPAALATTWLQAQDLAGDTAALLQMAGGAPLRALAMAEAEPLGERLTLIGCLHGMLTHELQPVEAAKKCEKFSIIATIDYLLRCVADLASSRQADVPLQDPEMAALSLQVGRQAGRQAGRQVDRQVAHGDDGWQQTANLHAMYGNLMKARKVALASNNANPQLILETLFVQWQQFMMPASAQHPSHAG